MRDDVFEYNDIDVFFLTFSDDIRFLVLLLIFDLFVKTSLFHRHRKTLMLTNDMLSIG